MNSKPSWQRHGHLNSAEIPKPDPKECLTPVVLPRMMASGEVVGLQTVDMVHDTESSLTRKIKYMEKGFEFVKLQHKKIMLKLREEIEELRQINTELQLQLVMLEKDDTNSRSKMTPIQAEKASEANRNAMIELLRDQVTILQRSIQEQTVEITEYIRLVDITINKRSISVKSTSRRSSPQETTMSQTEESISSQQLMIGNATVFIDPLRVDSGFNPHPPTSQEREDLIKLNICNNIRLHKELIKLQEKLQKNLSHKKFKSRVDNSPDKDLSTKSENSQSRIISSSERRLSARQRTEPKLRKPPQLPTATKTGKDVLRSKLPSISQSMTNATTQRRYRSMVTLSTKAPLKCRLLPANIVAK